MLFPKKVKFRKWSRGRFNPKKAGVATKGNLLSFGAFGLKADEAGEIKSNQIESARKTMARLLEKTGKIWIRIFPDRSITRKPPETGMGKGKGDPAFFVARVKKGRMIFEIDGVAGAIAKEALRKAGAKLPVKTRIISRDML